MSLKKAKKTKKANRIELEVVVDAATFEKAVEDAYRKNVKKMNVPGFRKGKAPRSLIEKMYGKGVFYEDAMNAVYPDALDEAISESGYEFVEDQIDFDVVSVDENGLDFKAVITVKPEVKIENYIGLKAEKPEVKITDEDVEAEVKKLQDRQARLVSIEDRAAQDGDTVIIDYEGFADDVAFEGGKGEKQTLVLGSNTFIPGFEDQIVGKKIGEEFDVNVTFPEEYHAENLAGKPAVFKCKLHEIKVRELPEINDDFAKDVSEFDTIAELKEDMRKHLTEHAEADAKAAFESALAEQLAEMVEADIPQAMFENAMDDCVRDFDNRLQAQGLSLDMYLQYTGADMAAFREQNREQAEKQVKVRLALEQIVKNENLTISDDEVEEEVKKFAEQYGMTVDQIKAAINVEVLRKDMVVEKAMHFVSDNAKAGKPAAKKSATKKEETDKKPAAKKSTTKATSADKKPAAKKSTTTKSTTTKKTATKTASADKKPAAKKSTAKKTEDK